MKGKNHRTGLKRIEDGRQNVAKGVTRKCQVSVREYLITQPCYENYAEGQIGAAVAVCLELQ